MALFKEKESKEAIQSELDDLLIVFGDLEERAAKYKVRVKFQCENYLEIDTNADCSQTRLQVLGEAVSDGEDDGDDDSSEDEGGVD